MTPSSDEHAYRFGEFTLDLRRAVLWRADNRVDLRPKCFELLRYFVQNPDRLLTKPELMEAIWPGVHVSDESLSRCVSDLRLALCPSADEFIETARSRGFLFTGPVRSVSPSPHNESAGPPGPRSLPPSRAPAQFTDLALPLIDQIVALTALRGGAYEGFYRSTRPYAGAPGAFIHDNVLVRLGADGVLRMKMGTGGVFVEGWIMSVQSQLYAIGTEFGTGGLVFSILHGLGGTKAEVIDGITLSSGFDAGRTPAASAIVLHRTSDLSDDPAADDARLRELGAANPMAAPGSVPETLQRYLRRDLDPELSGAPGDGVLRMPLAQSWTRGAPFEPI